MIDNKQKKTKYVLASDKHYFVLITDVPIEVTKDEIEEIAYLERRWAEQDYYNNLHCHGKTEAAENFWSDEAIPLQMPGLYMENPVLIPNKEDFVEELSIEKNMVCLSMVNSIVSYENRAKIVAADEIDEEAE